LIYHSGDEKAIVGIAEIISDPYPDPKQKDGKPARPVYDSASRETRRAGGLAVVDLKPKEKLKNPVTLAAVKAQKAFVQFDLVIMSRLSVMPVSPAQWRTLLAMSK
jgi:predicted RNA-binding protein with PUA-like domain